MEQCSSPYVCVCAFVITSTHTTVIRKDAGGRLGVEGAGPVYSSGPNKTCNNPVADDVVSKVI